jgi:outer membrane immunogenic protein
MRCTVIAFAATAGLAVTSGQLASGADLPLMAPIRAKAPPPVAVYDWTGPYFGIELGGKSTDAFWTATTLRNPTPPLCCGGANAPIDTSSPRTFDPSVFRVGGYGGFNWQYQSVVFGVEGDLAWADRGKSAIGLPGCASACVVNFLGIPFNGDLSAVTIGWDASLRGRIGLLVAPNVLLYGTGGVAWQNFQSAGACAPVQASASCVALLNGPQPSPNSIANSATRTGWTVGSGLEAKAYGNWLIRGEYRYADFGTWSEVLPFGTTAVGNNTYRYQLSAHTQIVTFGVAYKFDWDSPVIAKY